MKSLLFKCFYLLHVLHRAYGDCGCSKSRETRLKSTIPDSEGSRVIYNSHVLRACRFTVGHIFFKENVCIAKPPVHPTAETVSTRSGMVFVRGGEFIMGTNKPGILADGEHPARMKHVKSFWLDETEVSNMDFDEFVKEMGYKTEAEKFGDSFVLASSVKEKTASRGAAQAAPWWWSVRHATWRHPEGPGSNISDRMNHPVVHVSWNDARAFCAWRNARLPTEVEWEFACKKALDGKAFPWDVDKVSADKQRSANIWQGNFPSTNTKEDGYESTAPVDAFSYMSGLRVKNIIGNVWEWTEDEWSTKHSIKTEQGSANPPADGSHRVKKGGSFMCHASYCFRYRCEARSENTADTSASNIGFRCAADIA